MSSSVRKNIAVKDFDKSVNSIFNTNSFDTIFERLRLNYEILADLGKFKITFFVAFSTGLGYVLAAQQLSIQMLIPILGVFLMASGASALNHFQEREYDAQMDRTKLRPIPSGKISPDGALYISIGLIALSSVILYFGTSLNALMLGWLNIVWYNAIYTPLKRKFVLAVVPGALVGAIPPMIGWAAVSTELFHPLILATALFFFIWQIPHFWLLVMLYSDDYEKGGFPTLKNLFSEQQISRITFIWTLTLVFSSVVILLQNNSHLVTWLVSMLMGILVAFQSAELLKDDKTGTKLVRKLFIQINIYVLFFTVTLGIDTLLKF